MKNKKIIILTILMIITANNATAITDLGNGEYRITQQEFADLTNQQIAQYMQNSFEIEDISIQQGGIQILYNTVMIQPYNDGTTDYHVFNHAFPAYITYDNLNLCIEMTTIETCVQLLVYEPNLQEYNINNETITIESTYYQAYQFGLRQYQKTISMRDNLNEQILLQGFVELI